MSSTLAEAREDLRQEASDLSRDYTSAARRRLLHFVPQAQEAVKLQQYTRKRPSLLLEKAAEHLVQGQIRNGLETLAAALNKLDTTKAPFPDELAKFLQKTVHVWGLASVLYAIFEGLLPVRLSEFEFGARQWIAAGRFAEQARLDPPNVTVQIDEPSPELAEAIEEFNTLVRLLSIEDPFEGWRALAKEVTKRWPKGFTVEDAVREERGGYDA